MRLLVVLVATALAATASAAFPAAQAGHCASEPLVNEAACLALPLVTLPVAAAVCLLVEEPPAGWGSCGVALAQSGCAGAAHALAAAGVTAKCRGSYDVALVP